jgi:hypothetical protein
MELLLGWAEALRIAPNRRWKSYYVAESEGVKEGRQTGYIVIILIFKSQSKIILPESHIL